MLPTDEAYGGWPKSGEIDIMEARGNLPSSCSAGMGIDTFGSTMHWGPLYNNNGFNIPNSHHTIRRWLLMANRRAAKEEGREFRAEAIEREF